MGSGILLAASGTFVMVALVVGAATSWWLSRIAPERRRLAHAKAESGSGVLVKNRLLTDGPDPTLARLSNFLPRNPKDVSRLRRRLTRAGFNQPVAVVY